MGKSILLAGFVLALAILCAWAVVHFGKKAGQPRAKLRNLAIGFVVGGVVFSAYAFFIDFGQRQVTLFETLMPGTEDVEVPLVRSARFAFEHPGVEHTLTVLPKPGFARNAVLPVSAGVVLRMEDGEILVSERVVFEIRNESSGRGDVRSVWDHHSWIFRPDRAGPAVIEITLENPGIREVLLRIDDPEKRDGKRAPGY